VGLCAEDGVKRPWLVTEAGERDSGRPGRPLGWRGLADPARTEWSGQTDNTHNPSPGVVLAFRSGEQSGEYRTSYGGEFDPGSGSTLAACLMHASRTGLPSGDNRGGRVRNTWAICPEVGGSPRKRGVIPHVHIW
jgi:hypothetical protein